MLKGIRNPEGFSIRQMEIQLHRRRNSFGGAQYAAGFQQLFPSQSRQPRLFLPAPGFLDEWLDKLN